MNLILIALAAYLLTQFPKKNNSDTTQQQSKTSKTFEDLSNMGIFGDNTKSLFDSFTKLKSSDQDKTGVLLELLSNPIVFEMAKNMLFKAKTEEKKPEEPYYDDKKDKTANVNASTDKKDDVNSDNLESQSVDTTTDTTKDNSNANTNSQLMLKPSTESVEFFKPVEKVAGVEISKELYNLYDNWYIKR